MHFFEYHDGRLCADGVPLSAIADEVGTPFYCYSTATLERHVRVLRAAFAPRDPLICYAVKANSNQAVLATLAAHGLGMDIVSQGELLRALKVGVPGAKIIFAGVGKTRDEMALALAHDILGFNVESTAELEALSGVATAEGKTARVAIRVNPDVDAKTHAKISTGKSENKFGVPLVEAMALYDRARHLPGLSVTGVHMHIGSQIFDLEPYATAFEALRGFVMALREAGHALHHLDLGGGLGVPSRAGNAPPPSPAEYAAVAVRHLGDLGLPFVLEPGRMLVANAGVLVTSVIFSKPGRDKTFAIVDAAMNDLIRPTLYDAFHDVWPLAAAKRDETPIVQDIVGPVCESGDYLATARALPPLNTGDRIAIMTSGAYGAVMASNYNTRPLIPEVLVKDGAFAVVRPRQTYEALIGADVLAPWL
ncbi:MAG: diaminopimelate decarboxylase [Hyphomicrobiaceae bacterium]